MGHKAYSIHWADEEGHCVLVRRLEGFVDTSVWWGVKY